MTRAERQEARHLYQREADDRFPGRVRHVGRRLGWLRWNHAISLRNAARLRLAGRYAAARRELKIAAESYRPDEGGSWV